ncbi:MAG: hypothetical protein OEL53_05475 [Rhodospirillales bacterium]|nr:hypothetical protein [Rhodospirillales bacterium]
MNNLSALSYVKFPASLAAFVFWLLVIFAVWVQVTFISYPGFWLVDEEMAAHSIGHAAYIDNWLVTGEGHPNSYYQYLHPGVPLQLICWIIYRLTAPNPFAAPHGIFTDHLTNPEPFHLATQFAGLGITVLGHFLLYRRAANAGALATFVALALPATNFGNWTVSFWRLDSDTFSLPLACALIAVMKCAFSEGSLRPWFWLGFLLALAYLTKLNHISWSVGCIVGYSVWCLVKQRPWRVRLTALASGAGGFLFSSALGAIVLGRDQFFRMIEFQFKVATHTGSYGEGDAGLGLLSSLDKGLPSDPAFMIALLLAPAIGLVAWTKRRSREWVSANLPEAAMLSVSLLVGVVILVRHPMPHYFVPAASLLPFAALWILNFCPRRARQAFLIAPAMALLLAKQSWETASVRTLTAVERQAEIDMVRALPLEQGELRLWSFKVPAAEYIRRFIVQLSGVRELSQPLDKLQPQDHEFNVWRKMVRISNVWHKVEALPWRVAIFDRRYFETQADLPGQFRSLKMKITSGTYFIRVERSSDDTSTEATGG